MSGVTAIAFSKPSPLELRLRIEDDKRLLHHLGVAYIAGAAFLAYALTSKIILPPPLVVKPRPNVDGGFTVKPFDPHAKTHVLRTPHRNPDHSDAPPPVARHPSQENGTLHHSVLSAASDRSDYLASDLLPKNLMHELDQDKLELAAVLTRTDETRLAGRRGITRDTFNEAYNAYGKEGGKGLIPEVPEGTTGPIPTHPTEPRPGGFTGESQIAMANEGRLRSSESIMATIRSHSPGLRHIYNTFLKMRPGFGGKITVRFAVSPRGDVVDAALASTTTTFSEFDRRVLEAVSAWHFEPVKAFGNDIVTVPFTFSE